VTARGACDDSGAGSAMVRARYPRRARGSQISGVRHVVPRTCRHGLGSLLGCAPLPRSFLPSSVFDLAPEPSQNARITRTKSIRGTNSRAVSEASPDRRGSGGRPTTSAVGGELVSGPRPGELGRLRLLLGLAAWGSWVGLLMSSLRARVARRSRTGVFAFAMRDSRQVPALETAMEQWVRAVCHIGLCWVGFVMCGTTVREPALRATASPARARSLPSACSRRSRGSSRSASQHSSARPC
jgi:hypothetical protein